MSKITRTVISTEIKTLHNNNVVAVVVVAGEYAPIKGARKARKEEAWKTATEKYLAENNLPATATKNFTFETTVSETKYEMPLEFFMQHATVVVEGEEEVAATVEEVKAELNAKHGKEKAAV